MSFQKVFFSIVLLMSFAVFCNAQNKPDQQLRAIKVGLLTDRMKLTPQQSEKFWPVYNRYENEMRTIWRAKHALNDQKGNSKEKVDRLQQLEQQKVVVRGKYKDEFLKVISADQLAAMYQAEQEFKNLLLKRLKEK
jgi:hypothetical protein